MFSVRVTLSICLLAGIGSNAFTQKPVVYNRQVMRLSHHINTTASEYYPCLSADGSRLYFTAMDRTGFFDYKINYDQIANAGGEDIFSSQLSEGLWTDARDVRLLNTSYHEAVTQVLPNGDLLLTGNYRENLGPPDGDHNGSSTTDLFIARKTGNDFRVTHLDEPVNSLFTEADGYMDPAGTFILFVSDRPGRVGDHHKKGWKWNDNFWGNTDVWVCTKANGYWGNPVNLGSKVNTGFAERTPWLSPDGLTLFVSSNGYRPGKKDLDVYYFRRKNKSTWTVWEGPWPVTDVNTPSDEWCYREAGPTGWFARSLKLGFTPSNRNRNGAGFVFESNFRPGYEVNGQQAGSFLIDEQSEIFKAYPKASPALSLGDLLFVYNSDKLKPGQQELLNRLVDLVQTNEPSVIRIEGHTDSDGSDATNLELSRKRAETIRKYLTDNGLDESRIKTVGLGESRPAADNSTPEGRKANRRVEIYFQ